MSIETNPNKIKDSNVDGFDDLIIDITQNRINQELAFSNSIQTRAGVLIAFVGVVIGILFTGGGLKTLTDTVINQAIPVFQQNAPMMPFLLSLISAMAGPTFLIVSIYPAFVVLAYTRKLCFINPSEVNNTLRSISLKNSKHEIKSKLLKDFQSIKNENSIRSTTLTKTYRLVIIGIATISIPFIIVGGYHLVYH
jgi:hypothetical protein